MIASIRMYPIFLSMALSCLHFACNLPLNSNSDISLPWSLATSVGRYEYPSEGLFVQLKELGFSDIELVVDRVKSQEDQERLKARINEINEWAELYAINIWSIHLPVGDDVDISVIDQVKREKAIEEMTRLIDSCARLQPEKLVIHPSFEPVSDSERPRRIEACVSSLSVLVQRAIRNNAQLTVENLARTCLGNTSEEILTIVNQVPGLGVCCDVNHVLLETPEAFIENVGSRIVTLHISDNDGVHERHRLPGRGVIDWNALMESLIQIEYHGPFLFEVKESIDDIAVSWEKLMLDYRFSITRE